jgi:hypothetical protein
MRYEENEFISSLSIFHSLEMVYLSTNKSYNDEEV